MDNLPKNSILVVGTFDTKADELNYMADRLKLSGINALRVNLATTESDNETEISSQTIAQMHPEGEKSCFTGDRGSSVSAMSVAFEAWVAKNVEQIGGMVSAGGSGGTALVAPGFRQLPIGVPKVLVSTVASGDVGPYVGPSDIMMMYSVTDVQGLNAISKRVLGNAAAALAGVVAAPEYPSDGKQQDGVGMTMFGVTTAAIQAVEENLKDDFETFVFHATGVGGQSMEKLIDSGMLKGAVDLTTTEVADMLMGGVFACSKDRFGAIIRTGTPCVVSVGALDMVNFGAPQTVPEMFKGRLFYEHNPQVTLMRTTIEENTKMGKWIAERLNLAKGPLHVMLPEGGVSALDAPEMPFHDPKTAEALFEAIEKNMKPRDGLTISRHSENINDPEFALAAAQSLRAMMK